MPTASSTLLHGPTAAWMAAIVIGAAAGVMTLFGLTQRIYRGYWCWTGAMWLAAAGAALHGLRSEWPDAIAPAVLLLLSWPMLVLNGLRRFHARDRVGVGTAWDVSLLAVCFLAWLTAWMAEWPVAVRTGVYCATALLLHGQAALAVRHLESRSPSSALKLLAFVLVALAVVPSAWLLWLLTVDGQALTPQPLVTFGVVLPLLIGVLFTVYLCLVLTHERTVRDLRETQRQLRVLADIDMLTQVPNRRHFEELAAQVLGVDAPVSVAANDRSVLTLASTERAVLMLFDIDHFKHINDSLGHAAGDTALRLVARCARETLRTRDVIGRVGGDEFMLLLPAAAIDDALQIADRITRRLDAECALDRSASLSLSFGVVEIEPGEPLASAQSRADQALYEAKRQGRRRAVQATQSGVETVFGESRPLGLTPL